MKKLLLLCATLSTFHSNAQILWGAGSTIPASDSAGRFAHAFGTPNGWDAIGVSSPTALWTRTMDGLSPGAYFTGNPAIGSPSQSDGAALFDSDYLDNGGIVGAFGTGTCPSPHKGQLLSPSFDLTGYTDSSIQAKLYLYYRNFSINELSVGFSSDGGTTWTDFSIQQPNIGVNTMFNTTQITVPLVDVTVGVSNLSNCQLRLTFDGDYYFAMIDDISIELINNTIDFAIANEDMLYDYKTTTPPAPYANMPLQIAETYSPYNFAVLAINNGNVAITQSANPAVQYDLSKNVGGTWTSVLNADVPFNTQIEPGDTISVSGDITASLQAAFTANGAGDYRFSYLVKHNLADENTSNDSSFHYFTVTNDFSWYSASPLLADGGPAYSGNSFPTASVGNLLQELEWGAYYSFPDTTNIALDSVKYRMYVPSSFNMSNPEVVLTVKVYEWVDQNTDGLIDMYDEFILRTSTNDTIAVDTTDLGTYTLHQVQLTDLNTINPISMEYDLPYLLTSGSSTSGIYCITVAQSNPAGLTDVNYIPNCLYPAHNAMPYDWFSDFTTNARTPLKVTEGLPNNPGTTNWYNAFSGAYLAPSIALSISENPFPIDYTNVSENNLLTTISLYPNPVTNSIQIELNQKNPGTVNYILTDESGRILKIEKQENAINGTHSMDVSKLPAGTYNIQVKSNEGTNYGKFVKL